MTKKEALQLFEQKKVRTVWDNQEEKWYFSIVEVVFQPVCPKSVDFMDAVQS